MLVMKGALFIVAYVTCVTANLELVHVVFRHGERTPADTYPNDPHINDTLAPVGWGQLTNKGKLDQYNQGRWLRTRYDEFLGKLYSPNLIWVQSTDVDRTKMSAQLEMAGLFPPAPSQLWNPALKWQPIPIHTQPLNQDDLLLVRVKCLRYNEELENVMKSSEVKGMLASMNADVLYAELSNLTGMAIASSDDIQSLYSTLKAEKGFGLTLPPWTNEYYPEKLEPLTAFSFVLNVYNKELQKLKGGPLLKKIVTDIQAKAAGTLSPSGRKMFAYAGHDSTVVNLLKALQVWETKVPDYGIMAMIELHKQGGEFFVKVFLRDSTTNPPKPLSLPGCAHKCPLSDFVRLTADVLPTNLAAKCVPLDPHYTSDGGPSGP